MGRALSGKHIVLGASRKTDEMIALIEKQGGSASVRSLQGTVIKGDKEVQADLQRFVIEGSDWVIFTTGTGIGTLLEQAEHLGIKDEFLERVQKAKVASRGYKSEAALKKLNIAATVKDDDGTTQGLIRQLAAFDFNHKRVMVQLHGEKAPALMEYLQSKGAVTSQILPYQHIPPQEETVALLCKELIEGLVDAVCFTTAIQVHSLFEFARSKGHEQEIKNAFTERTVSCAVGKVTAEALREEGVTRVVVPEYERMGAMIIELSHYFEEVKG